MQATVVDVENIHETWNACTYGIRFIYQLYAELFSRRISIPMTRSNRNSMQFIVILDQEDISRDHMCYSSM